LLLSQTTEFERLTVVLIWIDARDDEAPTGFTSCLCQLVYAAPFVAKVALLD